jgi:hypothetical protein
MEPPVAQLQAPQGEGFDSTGSGHKEWRRKVARQGCGTPAAAGLALQQGGPTGRRSRCCRFRCCRLTHQASPRRRPPPAAAGGQAGLEAAAAHQGIPLAGGREARILQLHLVPAIQWLPAPQGTRQLPTGAAR